jgi:hypothetical protein
MANKKIIELDAASQVNSDALFPLSQLVDSNQKTLKATVAQMQAAMLAPVSDLVTLGESSGSIASFSTDISDKLFSCYVNVVASQAGSGTPAPDNVRAISGWSACGLSAISSNMWDEQWELVGGTSVSSKNFIPVKPNTTYYAKIPTGWLTIQEYDKTQTAVGSTYSKVNAPFTTGSDTYFIKFSASSAYGTTYQNNISINYPSTDTAYHKYNGTTHNIPFNQTVYGGVLDVLSGVLTVTHGYLDLGSINWTYRGPAMPNVFSSDEITGYNKATNNAMCEIYDWGGLIGGVSLVTANNTIYLYAGGQGFYVYAKDTRYTDANQFKTAMNGKYFVYELATPTVIQFTPTEVKTILGQNNIFADCGDIDLKYLETIGNRL